jgi:hypothetical protein
VDAGSVPDGADQPIAGTAFNPPTESLLVRRTRPCLLQRRAADLIVRRDEAQHLILGPTSHHRTRRLSGRIYCLGLIYQLAWWRKARQASSSTRINL